MANRSYLYEGGIIDQLRELREKAGFTQQELARAMHTRQPAIARFEAHKTDARLSFVRRYAKAIGVLWGTSKVADQLAAGWGWPFAARKAHWFAAGEIRSICGRWAFWGPREDSDQPSKDDCAQCAKLAAAAKSQ